MKILISSLTYPLLNGVTVSVNTSIDGFTKRGHEMRIISPSYEKGKAREEHYPVAFSSVARSVTASIFKKKERVFGIKARSQIKKIAEEFNPDVYWLHTVSWAPNAFETQMMKSKKPKVLFYHTYIEEYGRIYAGTMGAYAMRRRSKELCNNVDAVMVPGEAMKKKLLSYGVKTPVHVIPTGLELPPKPFSKKELQERFGVPKAVTTVLYVGRISKEKNLDILLDTAEDFKKKNVKARILFAGPGDIEEMKEKAKKMGIEDMVVFCGPLPKEEVQRVYGACDIFAFPSKTETQGLVVMEAMLANTPVVAIESPAQEEFFPEGKVVLARSDQEFSEKIIETIEDKEKRKKMAEKAKNYAVKNFSTKRMIEKQIKVFKEILES